MTRYIKQKFSDFVCNMASKVVRKVGLRITIEDVTLTTVTKFQLQKIKLTDAQQVEIAGIKSVAFKIYFWQSLFRWLLVGELRFSDIHSTWKVISEKPFDSAELSVGFQLRSKNKVNIVVESGNITCFVQLKGTKEKKEVLFSLPSITWNDYLSVIGNNLCFDYLKQFGSDTPISIKALLKQEKSGKATPFFNAIISGDGFTLTPKESSDKKTINKSFLLDVAQSKLRKTGSYSTDFIHFSKIPFHFVQATICTEDPNFGKHHGIDPSFVGYALQANKENGKLARGASTLTMQLVRNLFLHHEKNLLRKVEECVISLLLENYYNISKQDIFELYTNSIEFAPNIYGLTAASKFYFDKPFSQLTLTECLVLTYIIPRPKHFYDALLIQTEQLKKNLLNHLQTFSAVMLRKGLITPIEYRNIDYTIQFSKPFGELILKTEPAGAWVENEDGQIYWSDCATKEVLNGKDVFLGKNVLVGTHNRDQNLYEPINAARFDLYLERDKEQPTAFICGNTVPADVKKYGTLKEGLYEATIELYKDYAALRLTLNGLGELPTVNGNPSNLQNTGKPIEEHIMDGILFHRGNAKEASLFTDNPDVVISSGCQTGESNPNSEETYKLFAQNLNGFMGYYYLRSKRILCE